MSKSLMLRSVLQDAKCVPRGVNVTELTVLVWPLSVLMYSPLS